MEEMTKRGILTFLNTEGNEVSFYITDPRQGLEDETAESLATELQAIIDTGAYGDGTDVPKLASAVEVAVEVKIVEKVVVGK
ncbi:hypothetical protein AN644_00200 [Candidatus Epulonipiscium fishelsonii]|nr:hypothetical protein AN644_00200 [Epulopiscium sp. SCG-C06WGA-EpuloA1]